MYPIPDLPYCCAIVKLAQSSPEPCPTNSPASLRVDPHLESSGTPVNKPDTPVTLDPCYCSVHIPWHHLPPVEEAAGQVQPLPGGGAAQLVGGGVGHAGQGSYTVRGVGARQEWREGRNEKVYTREWYQVGLEITDAGV